MHTEKQKIFDKYFRSEGYKNAKEWFKGSIVALEYETMIKEIFAACDLVQEEQQKNIAGNIPISLYDDKWHLEKLKKSITNTENLIK